ncbi:MAG: hypothetical protein Q9219_007581 [cf. Caloplaca sp. 3 TL-2023]
MATSVQENLIKSNGEYASGFSSGHLALPPAKKYTVVTCMDARIDPPGAFGISLGDAHVIRNAGGSAREALRSLVISEQLLGTKEILLIKHTDCGMLTFGNSDAHAVVEKQLGQGAKKELEGMDFLPFGNLEQGVRDDVEYLKASKAIPDDVAISGWVYEVETGKVRAVK